MKQLEAKKELNLDRPEDVDWLAGWSNQAWQRIQELEAENNKIRKKTLNEMLQDLNTVCRYDLYWE